MVRMSYSVTSVWRAKLCQKFWQLVGFADSPFADGTCGGGELHREIGGDQQIEQEVNAEPLHQVEFDSLVRNTRGASA